MKIGKLEIKATRWPWQESGNPRNLKAWLNPSGSRFGGGWNYKLGIDIGGSTVILNLLFGIVRINWCSK